MKRKKVLATKRNVQTHDGSIRIPSALGNNNSSSGVEQKQNTLKLDPQIEAYLRNVKNKTM